MIGSNQLILILLLDNNLTMLLSEKDQITAKQLEFNGLIHIINPTKRLITQKGANYINDVLTVPLTSHNHHFDDMWGDNPP